MGEKPLPTSTSSKSPWDRTFEGSSLAPDAMVIAASDAVVMAAPDTLAAAGEPDTTVAAEPQDAVATAPPAPERSSVIALSTTPAGATVMLDGKVIGTTPLSVTRPSEGASASLTIKLARYVTHKQTLDASSADIALTLQRRGATGSSEPGDTTRPPDPPPTGRDGAGIID